MVQGWHAEFHRHCKQTHCTFRIAILKHLASVYIWYHVDKSCRTEEDLHIHYYFLLSRTMQTKYLLLLQRVWCRRTSLRKWIFKSFKMISSFWELLPQQHQHTLPLFLLLWVLWSNLKWRLNVRFKRIFSGSTNEWIYLVESICAMIGRYTNLNW